MAAQSTLRFVVLGSKTCHEAIHPWTTSCLVFYLEVLRKTMISTIGVFGTLYCLPVVIKTLKNGIDKDEVRKALTSSVRTTMFTSLHISIALGLSCVFRTLVGSYTQYTAAFTPSVLAALGFLCEDPKFWNTIMVMLVNTLLERLLLLGSRETEYPLTPGLLTGLFMASSGALLYCLRRPDLRCLLQSGDNPWFFYPPSPKKGNSNVTSEDFRPELMVAARLAGAGVVLQMARVAVKYFRHPAALARQLIRFDTYRLGLFLGGYAVIYKACSWALAHARGRDAAWHALPSGALAGGALLLYPRRIIALMAASTMLQMLMKWICKKKKIKYVYLWKFMFVSLSAAYLVHTYFVDPDYCPVWFSSLLNSMTGGISQELRNRIYSKYWHPARFPILIAGL